jgi:hypothetical protein
MSGFALLEPDVIARGIARLTSDLESGEWTRRFGGLASFEAFDVGYRLLLCDRSHLKELGKVQDLSSWRRQR